MFFGAFIVIRSVKSAAKDIGILEILSDKSEIEEFSIYTVYRTKSTLNKTKKQLQNIWGISDIRTSYELY